MNQLVARNAERKNPRVQSLKILGGIKVEKRIPEEKIEDILTTMYKKGTTIYLAQ